MPGESGRRSLPATARPAQTRQGPVPHHGLRTVDPGLGRLGEFTGSPEVALRDPLGATLHTSEPRTTPLRPWRRLRTRRDLYSLTTGGTGVRQEARGGRGGRRRGAPVGSPHRRSLRTGSAVPGFSAPGGRFYAGFLGRPEFGP